MWWSYWGGFQEVEEVDIKKERRCSFFELFLNILLKDQVL
jgi:hypothetical protein